MCPPDWFEQAVKRRGGVVRWRMMKRGGHLLRCGITRKKGKRGGRTVCYKVK